MNMLPQAITRGLRAATIATVIGGTLALSTAPALPIGPQIVAAADASSDIPGVPLPGAVAAGRLGGAIYDVVYRLSVAPGHVIVASLTGTAGTDFDLYLFDSSATTVLSSVGLLKKSIGPTTVESLTWPSRDGGTYYLDLNGATDVEGDYRLTVQMVPDQTPPVISIVLAGGRGSTNQVTVPVSIAASDDLSGVSELAFSTDGTTYSNWQPFQPSVTWTFDPGDGPRTLWAKAKNGVGLESLPARAGVTIDTVAPTPIELSPPPGSTVVGLRPTFRVVFSEPIDAATWSDSGLIVQAANGALISGAYVYDPGTRTGVFVPAGALVPGGAYVVTLGAVTDMAGNRVVPQGSWTIIPIAPTVLAGIAAPRAVPGGGRAQIDVTLIGAPDPADVEVQAASPSGGAFVPFTTLNLADGRASFIVTPANNTTYRLRYAGAAAVAPAQVDVPVLVRRSISLEGRNSSVVSRARVQTPVKLTAAIGPAAPGVTVSFRLYRFDSVRRVWSYAGSHGKRTDAAGRATLTWTPATAGSYYWRATVTSTAEFANGVSPVYRWAVRR